VRVALVTNIVPPYRVPVFRRLAETPGWRLRVFASARTEFDRSWSVDNGGLDVVRVFGLSRVVRGRTLHVPLALPLALLRFRPDVVVSGELGPRSWLALLYCWLAGVPLVVWAYPSRVAGRSAGGILLLLRRALLARARAVIGMGAQAREALAAWGVPPGAIHDAPNAHDAEGLRKALAAVDPEAARLGLRAGLGCRERVALFAGRLVASKGVAELLDAWDELEPGLRDGWTLLLLGSGPLEERVRHAVRTHRRGEIVHVRAVEPAEVAAFYAAAQLLVLPSLEEPWGLVANEAMASGLPVCGSRLAGCADDLLHEGKTGWVFDPRVPADFATALRRAMSCPDRERMRAAARRRAARFGPDAMAEGMRRAIRRAADASRPAPGSPRAMRRRGRLSLRSAAHETATAVTALSRRIASGQWDDLAPPLRALGFLGRELANSVTRASSARECPICGWSGPSFGPQYFAERFREHCRCYGCGSKERSRFAAHYVRSQLAGFFAEGRRRVLDVGPEPYSRRLFPEDVEYVSFDLRSPLATLRGDLAHAPFGDASFDLWLCFHVVDQIPDDGAAMRELFRLLRPGGIGLFDATVRWSEPTRERPESEARFGPLRRYGFDVVGRLEAAGFQVTKADPTERFSAAEIERFGLRRDPFLVCRRPA
jgi:glycosyltransferase involved in cell wall biosynthesis/SAM-dependent methyltransferase